MEDVITITGDNLTGSVPAGNFQCNVSQRQVLCKEMPFFVNTNGDIAYRNPHYVILDVDYGRGKLANTIVKALNEAYKLGFEYQRLEWR